MDRRAHLRTRRGITWFEFGLVFFGMSLPVGLVVMLVAPVSFFHVLGTTIVGTALIGLWMSALGLRLEHPERWSALKHSLRPAAVSTSPPAQVAER